MMRNSIKITIIFMVVMVAIISLNGLIIYDHMRLQPERIATPTMAINKTSAIAENTILPDTIKIATEPNYMPFSGKNAEGKLIGFEIELGNALCAELKRQCQFVEQNWEGIILGLKDKKYDAIMDSMSITPERLKQINFSDPYFDNSLAVVGHKGKAVNAIEKINDKKVGTIKDTISAKFMSDNYSTHWNATFFDTQDLVYESFNSGHVDYFISDFAPITDWIKDRKDAVIVDKIEIDDHIGIGVRKEDTALLTSLNAALKKLRSNGTYDRIHNSYFYTNK